MQSGQPSLAHSALGQSKGLAPSRKNCLEKGFAGGVLSQHPEKPQARESIEWFYRGHLQPSRVSLYDSEQGELINLISC